MNKYAIMFFILGAVGLSCWYVPFLRELLVGLVVGIEDPYRFVCWLLTCFHYIGWIGAGLVGGDIILSYSLMNVIEYSMLFLMCGNHSFDLYPLLDVILANGFNGRLLAFAWGWMPLLTYALYRRIKTWDF